MTTWRSKVFKDISHRHNRWPLFFGGLLLLISVIRFPVPDDQYRALFRYLAEIAVFVGLAVYIISRVNVWVGLFLILATFSCIYPIFGKASVLARQAVLVGCLWYSIVVLTVDRANIKWLLNCMCLVSIANTVFLALQTIGCDPYAIFSFGMFTSTVTDNSGLMANRNEASMMISMTMPAFFRRKWISFVLIPVVGLILARSTGGVVAILCGLTFYLLYSGKGKYNPFGIHPFLRVAILSLGSALGLLFLMFVDTPCVAMRLQIWESGIPGFCQHWLFGSGIGHWKIVTGQLHAHNDIFQIIFEMGIFAGVIILGYFYDVYKRISKYTSLLPMTAVVVIIANALVSFPFYIATTAMISVTWMAILEISIRGSNAGRSTRSTQG